MPRSIRQLSPSIKWLVLCALLAVLAARLPVSFAYGVQVFVLNAPVWLAYRRVSPEAAMQVSLLGAATGIFLWGQSPLLALLPLEIWLVNWMSAKWKRSLMTSDILYWLVPGALLQAIGYIWLNGAGAPYLMLYVVLQVGAGLINLVLGEMAADFAYGRQPSSERPKLRIEKLAFQLCVLLLTVPLILTFYLSSRFMYNDARSATADKMRDIYIHINSGVNDLSPSDFREFQVHSTLRRAMLATTFDNLTLDTQLKLVLLDHRGQVVESNDSSLRIAGKAYDWQAGGDVRPLSDALYLWQPRTVRAYQSFLQWSKSEFVGVYTLERVPYRLIVMQPVAPFQRNVFGLISDSLLLLLPLLFAAALGARWAVRRFSTNLGELASLSTGLPAKIRSGYPVSWKDSRIHEVSTLYRNFTEMSEELARMFREVSDSQEKLRFLVHYDPLTGLANRNSFSHYLPSLLERAEACGEQAICLFIDLDRFKSVNDTYGHEAGDAVLRAVGSRLGVFNGDHCKAFRLAGDEFVFILSEPLPQDLDEWIHRVHERLTAEPVLFQDMSIPLSFSGGVAVYPRDGRDPDTLLRNADKAMYEAKVSGRNQTRIKKGGPLL